MFRKFGCLFLVTCQSIQLPFQEPEVQSLPSKQTDRLCPSGKLYPLRVCEAKSKCTQITTQITTQESDLIKKDGWCAPSSDALQIDLDAETTVDVIEISGIGARTVPRYIRLDYKDSSRGEYQRYLNHAGSDLLYFKDAPNGRLRLTAVRSKSFKIRMVLDNSLDASSFACMRIELYGCDGTPNTVQRVSPLNPVQLEFGTSKGEWAQFKFRLWGPTNVKAYLNIMKIEVNWRVLAAKGGTVPTGFTPVQPRVQFYNRQYQELSKDNVEFMNFRTTSFDLMDSINGPHQYLDLVFWKESSCEIWLKYVKFFLTTSEIITFSMSGGHRQQSGKYATLHVQTESDILMIAPIGEGNSFREVGFRGNFRWTNDQTRHEFNSEYAVDTQINNMEFQQTVQFQQNDTTMLWHAKFDSIQDRRLAIRFPSDIIEVEIGDVVAGDVIVVAIPEDPVVEPGDDGDDDSGNPETLAGIVVGIVGAMIVVIFVASILIWRKRQQEFPHYTTGRECSPIYPPTQPLANQNHVDLIPRGISLPNHMRYAKPWSLSDQIPQQDRRRTAPLGYSPHRRQTSNQSRPLVSPPEMPEDPIYEPPATFRDRNRRIYGPVGTVRYASPEALRTKEPPPTISADHVKALEELGSGEFGEVMLVEVMLSCFPRLDRTDLPTGATKVLAACKRLKNNTSSETKKIFLEEANLMYGLRHRNILPLLAVIPDIPALLTGYSEHGDLRQYLRRRLTCEACDSDDPGFISYTSLLNISIQVASAMEYLESVRVVHRDLAARNCFVGRGLRVRVGDFGMSRNLYSKDYFKVTGNVVMPIRWSAWESIILGNFTTKSDVWSFGVTVYEVYVLCRERPLEMLSDEQVIQRMVALYKDQSTITSGMVPWLPRPSDCPEETWEIIQTCWQRDESTRPSFKKLHSQLRRQTIAQSEVHH